jgi:hypothetical protein
MKTAKAVSSENSFGISIWNFHLYACGTRASFPFHANADEQTTVQTHGHENGESRFL